jgi:hypothetical protein
MPFKVNVKGPFALVFIGDPHLSDANCNWPQLRADIHTIRETPAMQSVVMGDICNFWHKRLAHLYAEQEVTRSQEFKLAEWFFNLRKTDDSWMHALILMGNHDRWTGEVGCSPLEWLERGPTPLEDWQARVELQCPNGRTYKVWAAHNHPGRSIYNPTHGPQRRALFTGMEPDLVIAGDRHHWHLTQGEDQHGGSGRSYWAARCRGYKAEGDDYASRLGYDGQQYGGSIVAIFDPDIEGPASIMCLPDVQAGAEYLTWKLNRKR